MNLQSKSVTAHKNFSIPRSPITSFQSYCAKRGHRYTAPFFGTAFMTFPSEAQPGFDRRQLMQLGGEFASLYEERRGVLRELSLVEQHLSIGFSEPLNTHLSELLKKDVMLLCRMTAALAKS